MLFPNGDEYEKTGTYRPFRFAAILRDAPTWGDPQAAYATDEYFRCASLVLDAATAEVCSSPNSDGLI
jgi:hypothetical protein